MMASVLVVVVSVTGVLTTWILVANWLKTWFRVAELAADTNVPPVLLATCCMILARLWLFATALPNAMASTTMPAAAAVSAAIGAAGGSLGSASGSRVFRLLFSGG